jgi:hypothetical protein
MKEIVKLKKVGSEYLEYNSTSGLVLEEYQIRAVKKWYTGYERLFIITNFASLDIENKEAKVNVLELYKNDWLNYEPITNPVNKLFSQGQMIISKNYYVSKETGMPTETIYDEDGDLLDTVETNWDFYYKNLLEPYILTPLCDSIMLYIG